MSKDSVTYTFVKEEGNIHFRSKVQSFNLDHVTDKDIVSFYQSFSNFAAYDTGLLPVDGTGMLALRRAGNHTQVTYQHKPGLYYVNWGAYEGDKSAVSYLVAQPYRIVIIDFVDDNLLGARTFYSPIPATHPGIQLYHVNLPNINCKGYRGNGVGWICLYHNADWSQLPFNERLARALERCSGIETYNDANMSETDGPRFYQSYYKNDQTYSYIWDPKTWETKSQAEGFEWTLDENLWVPIMVRSRDEQDAHDFAEGAVPLTLADAVAGRYNAYYGDSYHPKPINALTNPSLKLESSSVMNWFIKAYNISKTDFVGVDTFDKSAQEREKIASTIASPQLDFDEDNDDDDEDNEEYITCCNCDDSYDENNVFYVDGYGDVCQGCLDEDFVKCHNTGMYLHNSHPDVFYEEPTDRFYDLSKFESYEVCPSCKTIHYITKAAYAMIDSSKLPEYQWHSNIWRYDDTITGAQLVICTNCIESIYKDSDAANTQNCYFCGETIPVHVDGTNLFGVKTSHIHEVPEDKPYNWPTETVYICNACITQHVMHGEYANCICGSLVMNCDLHTVVNPAPYLISESNYPIAYNAIVDHLKSYEMNIHDQYMLSVDQACVNCIEKVDHSVGNTIYKLEEGQIYTAVKDTSIAEFHNIISNDGHAFGMILSNAAFSLIPYNEII